MNDPREIAANQAQCITAIVCSAIGGFYTIASQKDDPDESMIAAGDSSVSLELAGDDLRRAFPKSETVGLVPYVITGSNELMSATLPMNAVFFIPAKWVQYVLKSVATEVRRTRSFLRSQILSGGTDVSPTPH